MDGQVNQTLLSNADTTRSKEWMHRVISLLEAAVGQLDNPAARGTLLEATLLLRRQIDPPMARAIPGGKGCLPVWQARKVRAYIDSHITGSVLVADLCALVQRSEAHFSRCFKQRFDVPPSAS